MLGLGSGGQNREIQKREEAERETERHRRETKERGGKKGRKQSETMLRQHAWFSSHLLSMQL